MSAIRASGWVNRFADPARTNTIDLGEGETAEVRAEIGDGELRSTTARGGFANGERWDGAGSDDECIATFVRSWTLADAEGNVAPITAEMASRLDEATRNKLLTAITKASERKGSALPNEPGAPSRDSSRGSASQRRRTKTT